MKQEFCISKALGIKFRHSSRKSCEPREKLQRFGPLGGEKKEKVFQGKKACLDVKII